jgi:hypothetical protein
LYQQTGDAITAASDYYLRRAQAGEIHMYAPVVPILLTVFGLSSGLALMEEHNIYFDGVCTCKIGYMCYVASMIVSGIDSIYAILVLVLFGVSSHATSVVAGKLDFLRSYCVRTNR